jgi:hypothetical protein
VAGLEDREPGRIIAAVLETAQPFEENGDGIALRDYADDSAHDSLLRPIDEKGA